MRVLAASNIKYTRASAYAAHSGNLLLAYYDEPTLLMNGEGVFTIPPQNLFLCPLTKDNLHSGMIEQAAFAVCFDPENEQWQEKLTLPLPVNTPIPVTAADPQLTPSQMREVTDMLVHILHSAMDETTIRSVASHLLYALLELCCAVAAYRQKDAEKRHNRTRLIALRQEIYRSPAYNWTIEEMCLQVSVSRTHLHRIYQETFGSACHTDVLQSRLLYARYLLLHSTMSIREIALACGFENDITFMRAFKKHCSSTPTTYRKQYASSSDCTRGSLGFVNNAEIPLEKE